MIILQKPVLTIKNSKIEYNSSNEEKSNIKRRAIMERVLSKYKKNIIKNNDLESYKNKQLGRRYN